MLTWSILQLIAVATILWIRVNAFQIGYSTNGAQSHKESHSRFDSRLYDTSRRNFFGKAASVVTYTSAAGLLLPIQTSDAAPEEISIYFGCGCFWHLQHGLVQAERRILNRTDHQLTSRAAYAGGKAGALNGKVCYHNVNQVADYESLGHAEVVSLCIPSSSFKDFAIEYTKLFDKNGYRPDQWSNRGSEYRNLIGFPGGVDSNFYLKQILDASKENGDKLAFTQGLGDDEDRRGLVYIMNSNAFPSFVAEQYHQFHDGFAFGENYAQSYNGIAERLENKNVLGENNCPNGMLS